MNTGATIWADDAAQGFNIITSHHDTHDQDIATGLNNCVTIDGLNKIAANFVPNQDSAYNIGSTTVRFQNEYLAGSVFLYSGNTNPVSLSAGMTTTARSVSFPDASGNAVIDTATQTLTNKTLTSPVINGATIATATATGVTFAPEGTSSGQTGELRLEELAANGTNITGFKAPDALAADVIYTMPGADGSNGQALTTNGSKVLAWQTINNGVSAIADATNGGLNFSASTGSVQANLKPSDLLTKSSPTTSDSVVIMDAAASNAAKTSTIAQIQTAIAPASQQLVRAWGLITQSGGSYSVAAGSSGVSVAKNSTGIVTVTHGVTMASSNYAALLMPIDSGSGTFEGTSQVVALTATTVKFANFNGFAPGNQEWTVGFMFIICGN